MGKAKQPVSINGIEFDALISQDVTYETEVPEYPTETGFVVNDTIILKPIILEMTLFLTNTPVTWKSRFGSNPGRIESVIKRLEDLYFGRSLVTVKTSDKTYTNMAITSFTLTKSLDSGYAREIPISFKQIRVTSSKTVSIPASYGKSGATGTNAGTANTASGTTPAASGGGSTGGGGSSGNGGSGGSDETSGSILYNVASEAGLL